MMGAQRPPALIRMPASEAEKARQKAEWDAKARDGQTLAKLAEPCPVKDSLVVQTISEEHGEGRLVLEGVAKATPPSPGAAKAALEGGIANAFGQKTIPEEHGEGRLVLEGAAKATPPSPGAAKATLEGGIANPFLVETYIRPCVFYILLSVTIGMQPPVVFPLGSLFSVLVSL